RCGTQARSDVGRDRVGAEPRVEAALLTLLVFLGGNVAWLVLFDGAQSPPAPARPQSIAAGVAAVVGCTRRPAELEACVCTRVLHLSVGRRCRMIRVWRSRAFFLEGQRCGPALVLQRDGAGRGAPPRRVLSLSI